MEEAEAQAQDWSDWREEWNPWGVLNEKLSEEQAKEVRLFMHQDAIRLGEEARRNAFEMKMKRAREQFEKEERERKLDLLYPFGHRIWSESIDKVRAEMVPAYTFRQFGALPPELQVRIWSIAARFEDPKLRIIAPMLGKRVGSSLIEYADWPREPFLAILHVCQSSRAEAMKVYTKMSTTTRNLYINTLYDNFYMGEEKWDKFKVLIDLVVHDNTTRSLVPAVQTDLFGFLNIRFLMVDLNIFGATPVKLWTKFPKLKILSIIFYPYEDITDNELLRDGRFRKIDPVFIKPQRGTWYGKRVEWVVDLATKSIERAKMEAIPGWRAPKVEALVRKTGTAIDFEIEEEFTDEEITPEYDDSDDEREGRRKDEAEANWRRQAAARMTHAPVPRETLKVWKRKYLPSRQVSYMDFMNDRKPGTYYTDSETEQGNFPDRYEDYEDEDQDSSDW